MKLNSCINFYSQKPLYFKQDFNKNPQDEIIHYLEKDATADKIVSTLKYFKTNEPFYTHKKQIVQIINRANDFELAIENLNVLLNYKDEFALDSLDVTSLLELATLINNGEIDPKQNYDYGFKGGVIEKYNIYPMLDEVRKDRKKAQYQTNLLMQELCHLQLLTNTMRNQEMFLLMEKTSAQIENENEEQEN